MIFLDAVGLWLLGGPRNDDPLCPRAQPMVLQPATGARDLNLARAPDCRLLNTLVGQRAAGNRGRDSENVGQGHPAPYCRHDPTCRPVVVPGPCPQLYSRC